MVKIAAPKETFPGERRAALTPANVEKLVELGAAVEVETGIGEGARHPDSAYREAGAKVVEEASAVLAEADLVLRVRKPPADQVEMLPRDSVHISFLDPFNETELVAKLAAQGVSAISMEMVPRTTLAQKMDALSSQANLAGYVTVVLAAERTDKVFPMMMTPAGTLAPCRVFVIGAGVAGLQAIAAAKRLGARVEAFDVRPVVEEQVKSLGAKFVKIDIGETSQTKDGYARQLTPEQLELQRQGMAKVCANSDVVITTAQVFGRPAPRIVTADMLAGMRPGSIVVDMAVESGGNVEGSEVDQEVDLNGVRVIGLGNLPARVAVHASQMYGSNLTSLVEHFWDQDGQAFKLDLTDEIMKGCLLTHNGEIVNERLKELKQS